METLDHNQAFKNAVPLSQYPLKSEGLGDGIKVLGICDVDSTPHPKDWYLVPCVNWRALTQNRLTTKGLDFMEQKMTVGSVVPLNQDTLIKDWPFNLGGDSGIGALRQKLERQHSDEEKQSFENGATSSKIDDWHLHIPEAEEALVARLTLGARKHSPTNWKKGGKEFVKARYGHLRKHLSHLVSSRGALDPKADDDLGAILCNASFLCWYRKNKPKVYEAAFAELNGEYPEPDTTIEL